MKKDLNKVLIPRVQRLWPATRAAAALNVVERNPDSFWNECKYVIAVSQERCSRLMGVRKVTVNGTRESVVVRPDRLNACQGATGPVTGRIIEIIKDSDSSPASAYVVLDIFQIGLTRHKRIGAPVLSRRLGERTILSIPSPVCFCRYKITYCC